MRKRLVVIAVVLVLAAAGVAGAVALRHASPEETPVAGQTGGAQGADEVPEGSGGAQGADETPESGTGTQEEDAETSLTQKNTTAVTMAEAPVFTTTTESGMTVTAPDAFLDSPELEGVVTEISAIEAKGNTVCVVLLDLETRRGIWYNADKLMYPASSIKAAYCTYFVEQNGGSAGYSAMIEDVLVNSSNDSYESLYYTGAGDLSGFEAWLHRVGKIELDPYRAHRFYPDVTANALASVWEELWNYASTGGAGSEELTGYLARTAYSPMGEMLRSSTRRVWSKAGWYPLDEYAIPATNDAGIVLSETGPYVMVVLTDISSNLDAIKPLVRALDAAHETMCGDAVAYYE